MKTLFERHELFLVLLRLPFFAFVIAISLSEKIKAIILT